MTKNKPLKWTTQRVNNIKSTPRVHKRTPSNTRNNITNNNIAATIMTAEIKSDPSKEIEKLQSELEFTYDTVATITVHFESLHHAYMCSKPELDKSKSATRLGEMEKELLTAYDDLGLQVNHLERKISKLEKRLSQLRALESIFTPAATTPAAKKVVVESPLNDELNFISSPCSSTDSSVADFNQFDSFYCDDWTLSQMICSNPTTADFTQQQQQQQGCDTIPSDFYQQFCYYDLNTQQEDLVLSYPTYS